MIDECKYLFLNDLFIHAILYSRMSVPSFDPYFKQNNKKLGPNMFLLGP